MSKLNKVATVEEAAALIADNDWITTTGFVGTGKQFLILNKLILWHAIYFSSALPFVINCELHKFDFYLMDRYP